MTTHRAARPLAFALALITLVACFVALEVWRDRVFGEPAPGDDVLYVRSGDTVRRMSMSFTPLVAFCVWLLLTRHRVASECAYAEFDWAPVAH